MKKISIKHQLIVFLLICLFSIPLTALGLRHYFNDARLKEQLSLTYSADDFKLIVGHAKIARSATRSTLLIDNVEQQQKNIVKLPNLSIDTRLYDEALIHFAEKQRYQPINAILHFHDTHKNISYPILYTNKLTSRIPLDKKIKTGAILSELQLATDNLFSTYRIESVRFVPKRLDLKDFTLLIIYDHLNLSGDVKRPDVPTFMQLKFVLFIYFSVVVFFFSCYLLWRKTPVLTAFWAGIVVVWVVFDVLSIIQRTQYSALVKLVDGDKVLLDKLFDGEKYFVEPVSLNLLAEHLSGNSTDGSIANTPPSKTKIQRGKKRNEITNNKTDNKTAEIEQKTEVPEQNVDSSAKNSTKVTIPSNADNTPSMEISPSSENSLSGEEQSNTDLPEIVLESLSDFEDETTDTLTGQGDTEENAQ